MPQPSGRKGDNTDNRRITRWLIGAFIVFLVGAVGYNVVAKKKPAANADDRPAATSPSDRTSAPDKPPGS